MDIHHELMTPREGEMEEKPSGLAISGRVAKGVKGFIVGAGTLSRFMEKFIPEPMSGCWLWVGTVSKNGYAEIYSTEKKKNIRASRFSIEHFKGITLGKLSACHKCDTPTCVNPDHLFAGTAVDNAIDMINKGRAPKIFGRTPWNRLLTHCQRGHPFSGANLRIEKSGQRRCATCLILRKRLGPDYIERTLAKEEAREHQ